MEVSGLVEHTTWSSAVRRSCSAVLVASVATAVLMLGISASSALADPLNPPPPPPAPPAGVPHLTSPDNLPPGTSNTPIGPRQGRGMAYLRELWHAVQTQDISMANALLLLTQRPLDPNATPPPGLAPGPQQSAE